MTADPAQPFTVVIETASWVNDFLEGEGSGTREHPVEVAPGATVRDALRHLTDRHARLRAALWDASGREIGEHIEVIVNDEVLGVRHTLDSVLAPGDRILLVGQFIGGA